MFWRAGTLSEAHLRHAIEGFGAVLGQNSTAKRKVKAVRRRFQTREENVIPTAPNLLTDEVFWRAGTLSEAHLRRAIEGFGVALG